MNREVHVPFWEGVGLRCPALLAYLKAYGSGRDARAGLIDYFAFYNAERYDQGLDRATPLSINGLGIQEGSFAFTARQLGSSFKHAVIVALIIRLVAVSTSLCGGIVFF